MNETKNEILLTQEFFGQKYFVDEFVSPYRLSKIVNLILEELGINQSLPPQMFYNYVKKGFIASNDEKKVSREEAIRWTLKYVSKKVH